RGPCGATSDSEGGSGSARRRRFRAFLSACGLCALAPQEGRDRGMIETARRKLTRAALGAAALALCMSGVAAQDTATVVDGQALRNADAPAHVGDWLSYSRTWDEQRFSPLDQINDENVQAL